jgi:hypothetical protein
MPAKDLRLVGTETWKRNAAILGYRRGRRSFLLCKNLFRNRKSRAMASAKLAEKTRTGTNVSRNRKVEIRSSYSKPRKSVAEKLLTSPI